MHACLEMRAPSILACHIATRSEPQGAMGHSLETTGLLMPCHCSDKGARTREIKWLVQSYTAASAKARAIHRKV